MRDSPASLNASKSDTTEPSFRTVVSGCRLFRIDSYSSILTSYVFSTHSIRGFQCASCRATRRSGKVSWKLERAGIDYTVSAQTDRVSAW